MPLIDVKDEFGNISKLHEYNGKYYPPFPNLDMDVVLSKLKDLPGRDDDITIVSFPKSGCHWSWQILNELLASQEDRTAIPDKVATMMEFSTAEGLAKQPSVRLLNTHLTPEFYPTDLIRRKSKIIFTNRNPKDVQVSFFYHSTKAALGSFLGDWNQFFDVVMAGKAPYENWFDWTKQWIEFFKQHPDIPVLRLNYEDMKMDLRSAVDKSAEFIGVNCDETYRDRVVDRCTFSTMKKNIKLAPERQNMFKVGGNPILRKGVVGDWKTHFTVAQNERYDEEYNRRMKGYHFEFEKYMF